MTKLFCSVSLLFLMLYVSGAVHADMGAVFPRGVSLSEPGQKAIIAFDGSKEILILQTDWKADRKTVILRFIPFPSPPVAGESENAFSNLQKLLDKNDLYFALAQFRGGGSATKDASVKVISNTAIGNHDLTVLEVRKPEDFKEFVTRYFASRSLSSPAFSNAQQAVVKQYHAKGFRYFVLDRVDLRAEVLKAPALKFTFLTKKLYYPLLTSNTIGGSGVIQLFIMTGGGWLDDVSDQTLPPRPDGLFKPGWIRSIPVQLTAGDAAGLDPSFGEMLGRAPVLFALQYEGALSFRSDIDNFLVPAREDLEKFKLNPVFKAILNNDTAELKRLLKEPADRFRDARMWTPLQFASAKGKTSAVRLLKELGQTFSDNNHKDFKFTSDSPLELAIKNGHEETAETVFNLYRIEPEVIDRAAALAEKLGMKTICDILRSGGKQQ